MSRMHHLRQRMLQAAERSEDLRSFDSHNEAAPRASSPPPRHRSPSPERAVNTLTPFSPGDSGLEGVVLSINVLPKKPGLAASGEISSTLLNSTSLLRAQMKRRYNTAAETVKDYIRAKYSDAVRGLGDEDGVSVEERKESVEESVRLHQTGSGHASPDMSEEYQDGDEFDETTPRKAPKKRGVKRKASHDIDVETAKKPKLLPKAKGEPAAAEASGDSVSEDEDEVQVEEDEMEIDIGVSVPVKDERSKESDLVGESMVVENESEEIDVSGLHDDTELGETPANLIEANAHVAGSDAGEVEEEIDVDVEQEIVVKVESAIEVIEEKVETKSPSVNEEDRIVAEDAAGEESEEIDVDSISILKSLKTAKHTEVKSEFAVPPPRPTEELDDEEYESDEKDEDFNFDKNVDEEEHLEEDYEIELPEKSKQKKTKARKFSPPRKVYKEKQSSKEQDEISNDMSSEQKKHSKEEREAKLRERKAKAARKELENLRIDTEMEKKIFSFTKAPKTKVKEISSEEEELSIDVDGNFEPIEFTPLPTPNPTPFATPYDSPKSAPGSPFRPRPSKPA